MIGLFSFFGRAASLKALDQAFRDVDLHPTLVPEAVKLTIVTLLKGPAGHTATLPKAAYAGAAELFGYCILGPEEFAASNGRDTAEVTDRRVEAAIAAGDGLDADLILLAFHAGLMVQEIADRFEIDAPGQATL